MKRIDFLMLVFVLGFLLSSCGGTAQPIVPTSTSLPSAVPSATSTPRPSLTPTLTLSATPLPTFIPTPSATLLPSLTPLPTLTPTPTMESSLFTLNPTLQTYVRENTPIPVPDGPITAENAYQLAELARLGMGTIVDVQLSPDRNLLLVQTAIGVYGYDADEVEEVWRFEAQAGVSKMAVPRLERWIAAAMNDGTIAVLNYQDGSVLSQWVSNRTEISDMAFSYDGKMLAVIGEEGLTVWLVGETEPLYEYPKLVGYTVHFTPDGESIIFLSTGSLFYASLETGKRINIMGADYELTYSSDGQRFSDGNEIWDANTGDKLVDLEKSGVAYSSGPPAFSQNGSYLAMAVYPTDAYYGVAVWETDTGKLLFILKSSPGEFGQQTSSSKQAALAALDGPGANYSQVAFSPDGQLLAASHSNGYVDVWDLETNDVIDSYSTFNGNLIFRKTSRLTIWDESEIQDIDPHSCVLIHSARDFVAGQRLNFSLDGRWLFADWAVWDVENLRRAFRLGNEIVAAVSPDGRYLYSFDMDKHIVSKRRMDDFGLVEQKELGWYLGVRYARVDDAEPRSSIFAISPTGNYFSTYFYDFGYQIWDIAENEMMLGHGNSINTSYHYYSPDGKFLAISDRNTVFMYQLEPELSVVQEIPGNTCGFSPDGEHMLVKQDGIHYVYTLQDDGQFVKGQALVLNTNEWPFSCKAAFGGENLLAAGDWSKLVLVDLTTGQSVFEIDAHLDNIASITFSPDGLYLATSSVDGTVKLWGIPPSD